MSRLCRLKTASHGDDGKWAYEEIVTLRKQRDELLTALRLAGDEPNFYKARKIADDAIASVKGQS